MFQVIAEAAGHAPFGRVGTAETGLLPPPAHPPTRGRKGDGKNIQLGLSPAWQTYIRQENAEMKKQNDSKNRIFKSPHTEEKQHTRQSIEVCRNVLPSPICSPKNIAHPFQQLRYAAGRPAERVSHPTRLPVGVVLREQPPVALQEGLRNGRRRIP